MKASRRTFIKQGALATIATFGAGSLLWSNMDWAMAQDAAKALPLSAEEAAAKAANAINEVPYISYYYVTPKVNVGQNVVINYYVTDYDQKEYMKDDHSETFTVEYWVNGVKSTLQNVKAGDNSVTLKSIPKGKVLFALQATDKQGRKTHRLYQEFLIVDPVAAKIPTDKILTPDLKKFNIYNDDTHPVETTSGLTAMLKSASDNGYRKVLLPQGRYRLDEKKTVEMVSNLTLDMNGSTFKLNPNALGKAMMLEMFKCYDSHVINGIFEGDLKEHDFKNAPNESEFLNAIQMGQDCQYCSFENIKIVDVTGYGSNTGIGGNGTAEYATVVIEDINTFTPGDIDSQGNPIPSTVRTTSGKSIDISGFLDPYGFFQLGVYLGYQGNPAGNWVYKAHFYGADQKYLETIEGYMYRRLYLPKNAKFVRFTLLSTALPSLSLFNFRPPYNCAFINVHHENIRCVGMVPSGFTSLLVEGNTFVNCGWELAQCGFDAEDGWDNMQDLTFRNNVFGKNPANDFLTAAGHNFVMENNTMTAYMYDRTRSTVFRNNTLKSATFLFGDRKRSGYPRIFNNTIEGDTNLETQTNKWNPTDCEYIIRDNVCKNGVSTSAPQGGILAAYFYKCKITGGSITGKVVHCDLKDIKNTGGTFEIYDSTLDNCELKCTGYGLVSTVDGCTVSNSQLYVQGAILLVKNSTLSETQGITTEDWNYTHELILINNKIVTSLDHLIFVGNSFKQIVLEGNTITSINPTFSTVLLNNPTDAKLTELVVSVVGTTFNAKGGTVLNIPRLPAPTCTLTAYFSGNTYHGIDEISKNALNAPNVKIVRAKPPEAKLAA
ncbi:MAG: hypothetical protein ABI210_04375 [Abditibacteriaceae bacterium]